MINDLLNIALVQFDVEWGDINYNLNKLDKILDQTETDLIVLPEMFATGFYNNPQDFSEDDLKKVVQWMEKLSIDRKATVAGSTIWKEIGGEFKNRLYLFSKGQMLGQYDKRHLFSYGGEHLSYTSGKEKSILKINNLKLCPLICYDLRFPVWSRNVEDYHLLIYVANWPAVRQDVWNILLQARAIENQAYVVGVNRIGTDGMGIEYIGGSKIIGPAGEILTQMQNEEAIAQVDISLADLLNYRNKYGFLNDRDEFTLIN